MPLKQARLFVPLLTWGMCTCAGKNLPAALMLELESSGLPLLDSAKKYRVTPEAQWAFQLKSWKKFLQPQRGEGDAYGLVVPSPSPSTAGSAGPSRVAPREEWDTIVDCGMAAATRRSPVDLPASTVTAVERAGWAVSSRHYSITAEYIKQRVKERLAAELERGNVSVNWTGQVPASVAEAHMFVLITPEALAGLGCEHSLSERGIRVACSVTAEFGTGEVGGGGGGGCRVGGCSHLRLARSCMLKRQGGTYGPNIHRSAAPAEGVLFEAQPDPYIGISQYGNMYSCVVRVPRNERLRYTWLLGKQVADSNPIANHAI